MIVVDVPVDTGQNTVGGRFQVIILPRTCGNTISVLHVGRQTLELGQLGATIRSRIGLVAAVISHHGRSSRHIILVLAVKEEEELILDNRSAKAQAKGAVMPLGYGQPVVTNLLTLQVGTGQEGIGHTLKGVGTTLGNRIHTTASKTTLTHIVRRNRNGHLIECLERDGSAATRQRTGFHTERIVERGTIDGNIRLAVVSTTNRHTAGRARLWRHLHDIQHRTTDIRHSSHLVSVQAGYSTTTVATHGIVGLSCYHNLLNHL